MRSLRRALLPVMLSSVSLWADDPSARLQEFGVPASEAEALIERWSGAQPPMPADSLLQAIERAVQRQAPVDLVIDKVTEGLAKRVPPPLLLVALHQWGIELSQAAEISQRLHQRFEIGDVTMRETVLRVQLLRSEAGQDQWLRALFREATVSEPTVQQFLRSGEAVAQLRQRGLPDETAVETASRWLAAGVPARQMGDLVRAIETAHQSMPLVDAARQVSDRAADGWTADEVLTHVERLAPDADPSGAQHDQSDPERDESPYPYDGRDLPASRSVEESVDEGEDQEEDRTPLDDGRDSDHAGERAPDPDVGEAGHDGDGGEPMNDGREGEQDRSNQENP